LELIKDYNLEVHYHLGKGNVVVAALSCKAHCNYLLTACLTGEESRIRVPPDVALYNVTLTPLLRGEIIATKKRDVGVSHIKRRLIEGEPKVNCPHVDEEETLWFKGQIVVPKNKGLQKNFFLMRPIHPSIPFTPTAQRCIMT
jgi:hypothetical protein